MYILNHTQITIIEYLSHMRKDNVDQLDQSASQSQVLELHRILIIGKHDLIF